MIFLTVGTHEPFDRLVRAVDEWAIASGRGHDVFGQITTRAGYIPRSFEWVDQLDPVSYREYCSRADIVVSHAGMGTIITALRLGKPLVMIPRRETLGETRNEHQVSTAQRFKGTPGILVSDSESDVADLLNRLIALDAAQPSAALSLFAGEELVLAVRRFIHEARP